MRYAAFISYRHSELDMEIAKKVHTGLETYHIPASVQRKTGKKKVGRVFRDQEELPIGSDLDDNISAALEGSEYLIVICSPRTPESYWVCKEIETFIQMHDRNHVLAVLIEGEPDESFPPQLLTDENGNPVEPLAADVRGEDRKERNTKFKTELLRLAAPVIGCTYDDLRQRDRERRIRRLVTIISSIAAVVAVAGTAFGIYNANIAKRMTQLANEKAALADEKTRLADEITVQYEGKQENQSRFYAEEALSLLKSGNREDAVLVAMEALPSEGNDRPYVAEAEYALSQALYAYDEGNYMTYDRTLTHDLTIYDLDSTEDRKRVLTIDSGSKVYVWNASDWSLTLSIDPAIDEYNRYVKVKSADADDTGVFVATESELIKYDYEGKVIYNKRFEDIRECEVCADTGKVIVVCGDCLYVLDSKSGSIQKELQNKTGYAYMDKGKFYADRNIFVTAHYDPETTRTFISMYELDSDEVRDVKISEGYYLDSTLTPNGNIAVLSCNNDMLDVGVKHVVVDLLSSDGGIVWTRELDVNVKYMMTFNSIIKAHTYKVEGMDCNDVIVTFEAEAFTIDENTGNIITSFTLPGDANALALYTSSSYGRIGYRQGNIDIIDFREGRILSDYTFKTDESIREWIITEVGMAYTASSSPDLYVVGWHTAPDMEDYAVYDNNFTPQTSSPDGQYYVISPDGDYQTMIFKDIDGKDLYEFNGENFITFFKACNDVAYVTDKEGLWLIYPYEKRKEQIKLTDYDFDNYNFDTYISPDGSKAVFYTLREVLVMDITMREKICISGSEEGGINKVILSSDGSKIYVMQGSDNLYIFDTSTGEQTQIEDDRYRSISGSLSEDYLAISNDDKYVALCCRDGMLRILNTSTLMTYAEIPLQTYLRAFVAFTDDGSHIVMQGDDYKVRIWDMDSKSFVTSIDGTGIVDYIVCNEESNLIAVCQGYDLFLFETEGYGCVAYAGDGVFYLKTNDSILLSRNRRDVHRIYYKDYKKLMEEACKQFPGAALNDEKKAKYNIN